MKNLISLFLAGAIALAACSKESATDGAEVRLDRNTLALAVGEECTLKATVVPEDTENKTVVWRSSDATVATVSDAGLVKALAVGTAVITAEIKGGGKSASCSVAVGPERVESVELDAAELALKPGDDATLTATVRPADAADIKVAWSSSDEAVATVGDEGLVEALMPGTATITATAGGKTATCAVTVEFPLEMVKIAKGTFLMGDSDDVDNNRYKHEVTLTRDFYMSACEVTCVQYAEFLNAAGVPGQTGSVVFEVEGFGEQVLFSTEDGGKVWTPQWNESAGKWEMTAHTNTPMIYVSWYGAKAYADWANTTLPTEAQWEYACRAGTSGAYFFGADKGILDFGWFKENSEGFPHDVRQKLPNPWGLYDMYGNVYEWCSDWYGVNYYADSSAATDPQGPVDGTERVLRGKGYANGGYIDTGSASRDNSVPSKQKYDIGFRVVYDL